MEEHQGRMGRFNTLDKRWNNPTFFPFPFLDFLICFPFCTCLSFFHGITLRVLWSLEDLEFWYSLMLYHMSYSCYNTLIWTNWNTFNDNLGIAFISHACLNQTLSTHRKICWGWTIFILLFPMMFTMFPIAVSM